MASVCVVGAGVVGLSTAVCLQESLPGVSVTVIAENVTTATTSDGAAGIFRPTLAKTPGTEPEKLRKWLRLSQERCKQYFLSGDSSDVGISLISGYIFSDKAHTERPLWEELSYNFHQLDEEEMGNHPGPVARYGWFCTTLLIECRKYLPHLTKRFTERGGKLRKERLKSINQLGSEFDVVVNCAGFGNSDLVNDPKVVPVRGHLLRVHAPWVKHFVYQGENTYIVPGVDNVIIGGCRQEGRTDLQPTEADKQDIWRRAVNALPSLKHAKFLYEWVGLRPTRSPLRLETELLPTPEGGLMKVVHNYGHGGEGVSLAWGTGVEACHLVEHLLKEGSTCVKSVSKL